MFAKYKLKIGCLNKGDKTKIKCTHNDRVKLIENHEIFTFLETWLEPDGGCPSVPGYINVKIAKPREALVVL